MLSQHTLRRRPGDRQDGAAPSGKEKGGGHTARGGEFAVVISTSNLLAFLVKTYQQGAEKKWHEGCGEEFGTPRATVREPSFRWHHRRVTG